MPNSPGLLAQAFNQTSKSLPSAADWPVTPPVRVARRIATLLAQLPQPSRWQRLILGFTSQFRQNMAELEALTQYSSSPVVWDIAHLNRKKAQKKLSPLEQQELDALILYHDSPAVHRITTLKLKEYTHTLSVVEQRELRHLQRNLYQGKGIPAQVLDLLWTQPPQHLTDSFL